LAIPPAQHALHPLVNVSAPSYDWPLFTRSRLAAFARSSRRLERDSAEEALEAGIDDLAQLSAIDGAVLAGPGLSVYGGGYLMPSDPNVRALRAANADATKTEPFARRHGGRHQAGFSFAYDNPGGVAFVVSEDGPVRCAMRIADQVVVWLVRLLET
jgi:hypothetical protein